MIAIIGILIALLLPAVQAAREAARRTECKNHLKQLALGCLLHEDQQGFLPTGGWGWRWAGEPDRGFGKGQPGGWAFNILPFIEQGPLRELGAGGSDAERRAAGAVIASTPVATFYCPTRRSAKAYPYGFGALAINIDLPEVAARTDYAASSGSLAPQDQSGPTSYAQAETFTYVSAEHNGICQQRSQVRLGMITDGTSNTYLVGERNISQDGYQTGRHHNDNEFFVMGHDRDINRWAHENFPPTPDTPGRLLTYAWGSAHSGGFHMAFCDGSVQSISYSVDLETHSRLGNRDDGLPVGEF